ncbi:MAG: ABC transporter permease [Kiritimatiellaeota bacterium]|nr:ABC transporter permease [Kiritimatiellota bacterium]
MTGLFRYIRSIGLARSVTLMVGAAGAAALFVWTLGFAVTTLSQRTTLASEMSAPYDCWVATGRAGGAAPKGFGIQELVPGAPTLMIPPEVIEATRNSPLVRAVEAVSIFRAQVRYEGFTTLSTTPPLTMGMTAVSRKLGMGNEELGIAPLALSQGRWSRADADTPEVVVSESMFISRDLAVPAIGTTLQLSTGQGVVNATLVGLLKNRKWVSGFPTGFVSDNVMRTLMPDFADPALANLLLCRTGREDAALALRAELIAACGDQTGIRVVDRRALVAELQSDLLKNFKRQAPLLLMLAVLMAACLIGTAVRISIQTRLRVFAQYRILGMTRGQLVRFIVRELAALLAVAWALGCAVGFGILVTFTRSHEADFPDGIPNALYAVAPVAALALLAAVSAVMLVSPLKKLFRAEPLAGLTPEAVTPLRLPVRKTALGALLAPMPLLLLLPFRCPPVTLSALILLVGLPCHLLGLYWLLPALLRAVERGGSHVLLRNSTGRSYGRTQALVITLMAGLGSYCAIQIWGASMIAPFVPSRELPDVIASFEPSGIPPAAVERFAALDGIRDFQPFTAEQHVLDEPLLEKIERFAGSRPKQNNVLVINFSGQWSVVSGQCIIPTMFARQGGFAIGDAITIRRVHPDKTITTHTWEITGIEDINWHLVTARAGLRGRNGAPFGTLAPVFISDPAFDGANAPARFAWFNLAEGAAFADVDTRFKETLSAIRNPATASASSPHPVAVAAFTPPPRGREGGETRVTLHPRDEIADGTIARGAQLIGALARLPFYALILLTVGITAIVQANIQSRRNEFAMLRGIGMTRRQLFALLCNEVTVLLISGIAASVLFGICVGWVFTAWTRAWMPFGGLPIRLHIPWLLLMKGIALTFALGAAYALIPIRGFMRKKC